VTPVERIIFNSNVQLSQLSNSRVQLYELQQMSIDIVDDVKAFLADESLSSVIKDNNKIIWGKWYERQKSQHCDRVWYESNLSLLSVCS